MAVRVGDGLERTSGAGVRCDQDGRKGVWGGWVYCEMGEAGDDSTGIRGIGVGDRVDLRRLLAGAAPGVDAL